MKKHILTILISSLVISLSGCSNNETNNVSQVQESNKIDVSTSTNENETNETTNLSSKYTED